MNDRATLLDNALKEEFHNMVANDSIPLHSRTQDIWKKLLRLLKYLDQTKDLELTLEAEKGAVTTITTKQKLNTRSSTEAELVGADDAVTQAMWTRNVLEAQGYSTTTTIYQDNTSAILMEKKESGVIDKTYLDVECIVQRMTCLEISK